MVEKDKLLMILKDLSYEEGDFTLVSGKKSTYYIDAKETTLNPEGMFLIGKLMYQMAKEIPGIEAVGGVSIGGDPLVCAVVLESYNKKDNLAGFLIRKEPKGHGTNRWVEGGKNLKKGMSVVILEDVITTGGSSLRAIEVTEKEGYNVKGIVAILDRLEGGKEAIESKGYLFRSIFTLKDLR
ncbi:MAG TPA: orotate phosphoribosyltransferase [Syntrophorhabdus sp.]|jgi:orotate phosphoribosyltransferase|nr:orotate phosphoribosyltransferase [Syntrophorhabdus sp.]OPX93000.1 MAG: Orotate phosphoribosyltransferase [Syntrophorhabdus sp. PtaB.Bin027]OQB77558.1 MAG: Orotate phosphoribosyltransferase [Deltaproteobacteria bacterium ADurb.Bin135]HQP51996.1 orotate phosphoribosyltransferase [Syntrophorhabdaceae bacterium]NMC93521.1 orotate phosphoribosyltransferase [Syntrophorhabdus sp.]